MTFTKTAAAVAALLALSGAASGLSAQAQTSDRSGAMTLQFTIAKWVEIVSDAPSTHNLTEQSPDGGVAPGVGMIDTPDGMVTREIRANTLYRLSVQGLTETGRLEFLAGQSPAGTGILLSLQCKLSPTERPASAADYSEFDCINSGPMVPTSSSWVTLRAFTDDPAVTEDRRAGLYQATVYLQIEAL